MQQSSLFTCQELFVPVYAWSLTWVGQNSYEATHQTGWIRVWTWDKANRIFVSLVLTQICPPTWSPAQLWPFHADTENYFIAGWTLENEWLLFKYQTVHETTSPSHEAGEWQRSILLTGMTTFYINSSRGRKKGSLAKEGKHERNTMSMTLFCVDLTKIDCAVCISDLSGAKDKR